VADVFSAMTTTRPYRKALPLAEALKRLGGAAGTQLDELLVTTFISGLETAADAPLPGQEVPAGQLWIPPPLAAPRPA
jgi:HD-GYP domain-containing protein (c-di-GMP phosphodiesterase class II)